jgi:hypothetical protein
MSNSGRGRWAHFSVPASEPLEDPRIAAHEALLAVPWLYATDRRAIIDALDRHGLTICWKAPGDE